MLMLPSAWGSDEPVPGTFGYLSKIDVMANVGMDGAFYFSGATTAHIDVDIFAGESHG